MSCLYREWVLIVNYLPYLQKWSSFVISCLPVYTPSPSEMWLRTCSWGPLLTREETSFYRIAFLRSVSISFLASGSIQICQKILCIFVIVEYESHFRPDLIQYDKLSKSNPMHNLNYAFKTAEEKLGITPLLDAEGTLLSMISYTHEPLCNCSLQHGFKFNKV